MDKSHTTRFHPTRIFHVALRPGEVSSLFIGSDNFSLRCTLGTLDRMMGESIVLLVTQSRPLNIHGGPISKPDTTLDL